MALLDLIKEMDELQKRLQKYEEAKKPLAKRFEHLRLVEIPAAMAEDDIRSITVDGIGRCGLTGDLYVSAPDKLKLHAWLRETGNETLITETVNAQTLKSFCKEQSRNGNDLPEEVLKITPFSRAVIYRN